MPNKPLIAAVVVMLAGLAPLLGFSIGPEEQAALIEGVGSVIAGLAGIFAVIVGVRDRARKADQKAAPHLKAVPNPDSEDATNGS